MNRVFNKIGEISPDNLEDVSSSDWGIVSYPDTLSVEFKDDGVPVTLKRVNITVSVS